MRYPETYREMEDRLNNETITPGEPDALDTLLTDLQSGKITKDECKRQLRLLINKDFLTGLLNKEGIREALSRAIKVYQRDKHQQSLPKFIAVLFADGDGVKKINDGQGHKTGDEAIRVLARAASNAASRPEDSTGREGGDEIVIVLPDTDLPGALVVAEDLRQNVMQVSQNDPRFTGLSVSIGVALYSKGMTADELIKNADEAMYLAKRGGRNSIAIHPASLPQETSVKVTAVV